MLKTLNRSTPVIRAIRSAGFKIAPLAGVVSQNSSIYRFCLLNPAKSPVALVGPQVIADLRGAGIALTAPGISSISTSIIPPKSGRDEDEDDFDVLPQAVMVD